MKKFEARYTSLSDSFKHARDANEDPWSHVSLALSELSPEAREEMVRRLTDINFRYRALAEKVGEFYMVADEHNIRSLTATLDLPMRKTAESRQVFAAIMDQLKVNTRQHH